MRRTPGWLARTGQLSTQAGGFGFQAGGFGAAGDSAQLVRRHHGNSGQQEQQDLCPHGHATPPGQILS
jgi:hypothetical protein